MIYNAISAQAIIAKVYRDHNIDDNIELDAIEWIGEAMDAIGAGTQLIDKEEFIVVTSHTGTLPHDLQHLNSVYAVDNAPLKENWEDEEFPYDLSNVKDLQKYMIGRSSQLLHDGIGDEATDLPSSSFNTQEDFRTIFQELQGQDEVEPTVNDLSGEYPETYKLNGNQLKTSFENALVLISYKALPLDDQGYPLVPDNYAFKEALTWYIAKKLILGGKKLMVGYETANNQWLKYCTQARNRANYPDLDGYQKFMESWVQMVNTRDFNRPTYPNEIQDGRTGQNVGPTGNFRVTENGVERITQDNDTRLTENN